MPNPVAGRAPAETSRVMRWFPVTVSLWRRSAVGATLLGLGCMVVSWFVPWAYAQASLHSRFEPPLALEKHSLALSRLRDPTMVYIAFSALVVLYLVMATRRLWPRRTAGVVAAAAGVLGMVAAFHAAGAMVDPEIAGGRPLHSQPGLSVTYGPGLWWGVAAVILLGLGIAGQACVGRLQVNQDDAARLSRVDGYHG
jgi:hypothetical protein